MLNISIDGLVVHIIPSNIKLKILNLDYKITSETKWNQEGQSIQISFGKRPQGYSGLQTKYESFIH